MLHNLKVEMTRINLSDAALARTLHKTDKTIREKKAGRSQFSIDDARLIRDSFFPELTLEYLFEQSP